MQISKEQEYNRKAKARHIFISRNDIFVLNIFGRSDKYSSNPKNIIVEKL